MDRVRELLKEKCLSLPGSERVDSMQMSADREEVGKWLSQTWEFAGILRSGDSFPSSNYLDVRNSMKKARTSGAFLDAEEFLDIRRSLDTIDMMISFFEKQRESYPRLYELSSPVHLPPGLSSDIQRIVDEEGKIKDNASDRLSAIRKDLRQQQQQLRKSIDSIFREAVRNEYVPEGASITIRDGRMVIPVLAEYKRRIKGFIHDESATGQTVYLEPAAVLEANNALKELEYAESREIVRILMSLTDRLRDHLPDLKKAYEWMGIVDFIRAKARVAIDMEAEYPVISDEARTKLINARHPLLFLNYRKSGKTVVPLTLNIDKGQRLIIISGPNAGGKSVCLKTVGLLQYMWQCGLLVPASEESTLGIYGSVFIDIGDEQSIENDLSTYSSHLTFMKFFLENASRDSLILIDEFGTGTDPLFGGAIAESLLEQFVQRGCRGIITTHYSNIKKFAEQAEGVINGAMKYDIKALEPLYVLQLGKPGSSFSFEVARKIGLPSGIIDHARDLLGSEQISAEDLIVRLEKREQRVRELETELRTNEREAARLREKYEELYEALESDKKEILKKAREEASDLLSRTNREIEKTIRHIKENQAEKKETRKVRERLTDLKKKVAVEKPSQKARTSNEKIAVGDSVRIAGRDVTGKVLDIRGNDAEVQVGALKTMVKLKRLEKISHGQRKQQEKGGRKTVSANIDLNSKLAQFSGTLDIRGVRGDEAIHRVEKYIDDALLFNTGEVRILHGKGDGILRKLVREQLKNHPQVASFNDEHVERGGAGITVVEFK